VPIVGEKRQVRLPKLTVSQRLWLGLGVILAVFAAAYLVSLRASHRLDATLASLVDSGAQRSEAAFAMGLHLDEMSRAAQQYMGRQARQRARLEASRSEFEQALQSYRRLATTERSRAFADQAAQEYARMKQRLDLVMQLREKQAARIGAYNAHRRLGQALLETMPEWQSGTRGGSYSYQRTAAQQLARHISSRAGEFELDLRSSEARLAARLRSAGRAFSAALSQYVAASDRRVEREWAAFADRWFNESNRRAFAIIDAESAQRKGWQEFVTLRDDLQRVLDESIQPAARAEFAAAVERASATSREANTLISRALLLALGLGVLVAVATSRAVRAPLRALVASSRRLAEGDFSYRVPITGSDELGELTTAFNEMAGKLQVTTVSRTYMESIVNSMGEALLVSRDGVIETVNPAAERLLGFAPDAMVGRPVSAIAAGGLNAADGCDAPSRATVELLTRGGETVPAAISMVRAPSPSGESPLTVCVAQDLRERLAAEQHQRRAAVVFENTQEGIILADAGRRIVLANPAFTRITGYGLDEVRGKPASLAWSVRNADTSAIWNTVEARGEWQGEIWMECRSGLPRPVWMNINVVQDEAGRCANYVSVFSDITAIKDVEARLHHLAHHDALTDLPNRRALAARVETALEHALEAGESVALLYLDLDDFKHVNDTLGHHEGDRLLQAMADRLRACLERTHCIARLGGDEFVVFLDRVAQPEQAASVAERTLGALAAPLQLGGLELRMRASIGISLGPQHGTTAEELLKAADAAMYRAKGGGRGTYEFFSAELTRHALERLTLQNALRHPDLREQLVLEYQPQVSLTTGRLVGVEALLRWEHPARGRISPLQFIPLAEEIGLIRSIGDWVLRTACAQAAAWRTAGFLHLRMAVNVSAHQIRGDGIVDSVREALQQTGLEPSLLELEVTEGALQTGEQAQDVLRQLKHLGVRLALDDFGTGYSALSSLKLLPFDRLKIDRSFVRDLQDDVNGQALARAVISMGRSLGLEVIAEGVESQAQRAFLHEEGCDEMQGFLIGRPMPADELAFRISTGTYRLSEPAQVHAFPGRDVRRVRALNKARAKR
jgi:diguanylate cyclase (GGDEF)-like protein/PAS domain S-box-containing protein